MQKISLTLNVILSIAVAGLYYLHFSKSPNGDTQKKRIEKPVKMPEVKLKQTPVVYINADSLWEKYKMVTDMRKELETARNNFEKKFEKDYHNLEQEYIDLRDKAATLTQEDGMAKQQELMLKEQKLGEYRQKESERLAKLEADKTEKIQQEISSYLQSQYRGSPYAYILGYSHGGGILFANDSLEITEEVIDGLNATYKK